MDDFGTIVDLRAGWPPSKRTHNGLLELTTDN